MESLALSSMKRPIVSIVVVTYNHENFIDECLASCVKQATESLEIEIVVADDGSSDETQAKVRHWASLYPGLIRPVLAPRNAGIAANFNQGIARSRGELIAWIGGDDIMLEGKISRQVAFLGKFPKAAGCYHDAEVFSWPSGTALGLFSQLYAGKAAKAKAVDTQRMLDSRYQMLPSTVMVRRSAMPIEFDTRLRFHNDYLFDLETIIAGGPFMRMEGVLARYRKHEKSIGLDPKTRATMLEENLIVCAIVEARYPRFAGLIRKRAVYYISLDAVRSFSSGDAGRARELCKALASRGARLRALFIAVFGGQLARLTDARHRRLAIKLRSLFG